MFQVFIRLDFYSVPIDRMSVLPNSEQRENKRSFSYSQPRVPATLQIPCALVSQAKLRKGCNGFIYRHGDHALAIEQANVANDAYIRLPPRRNRCQVLSWSFD